MYAIVFTTAGSKWAVQVEADSQKHAIMIALNSPDILDRSFESIEAVLLININ